MSNSDEIGLGLAEAEGALNFLARITNVEPAKADEFKIGIAVLQALEGVQKARKAHQKESRKRLFASLGIQN